MKKLLFSLLLLSSSFIYSQHKNYTLYFKNGQLFPLENKDEWQTIVSNKNNIDDHFIYVCLQFYDIPTAIQKKQIEALGIKLLNYMPRYSYLTAIPENISLNALEKIKIRSIIELDYHQKLHPQLLNHDYPDWALESDGKINIKLLLFSNVDFQQAKEKIMLTDKVNHIQDNSFFNQLTLQADTSELKFLASFPFVQFIEPTDPPSRPENYTGRTDHRTNVLSAEYSGGFHYDGSGIKIALGDDGPIGPHIDYEGRIGSVHVTNNTGNHGDHVAGTIMGAGNLNPLAKGMAPGAEIHVYDVWDAVDSSIYSYYNPGIYITSISYSNGCNAGYTTRAYNVDQEVRLMPSLLPVFSAGNEGATDCGYGAGIGWGNVTGGIKIGKNVMAVANLDMVDVLSASSSRGPASDGRIKPDISAVGTNVLSTISANSYDTYNGTSMACPGVSGTLTALYDAYLDLYGAYPESALMKAVLLNSADDIGNTGPDFKFGWGRLNARRALKTLQDAYWFSDSVSQGQTNTHQIAVPAGVSEFRVMVYWSDYEGTVNSSVALVNNIDIEVSAPGLTTYYPWLLNSSPDSALLNANATTGVDTLNNMEQVSISNPANGTYQLHVTGYEMPDGALNYYVVYEFPDSSIVLTHPNGGESIVPFEAELIRWDSYGSSGTYTVEYSADSGNSWAVIDSGIASTQSYAYWQVPDTVSGKCLIRVGRGSMYDQSDTLFSIINVPSNLQIDTSCMDYFVLSWDSVSGASSYDVFQLGSMYMDSIGNTTFTNYSFNVSNSYTHDEWYAVRARGNDNAIGRRCNAIEFDSAGVQNCILDRDMELTSISSPLNVYPGCNSLSNLLVSVTINNTGKQDVSNFSINYMLDGYPTVTELYNNTILSGNDIAYTFIQTLPSLSIGDYKLTIWISDTTLENYYNDTLSKNLTILNISTVFLPLTEDFEALTLCSKKSNCEEDTCDLSLGWTNLANMILDDIDWRVNEGNTPSESTGPSKDHTLGTSDGNYIYLEATSCFEKTAELVTPCIELSGNGNPYLTFWYYMYGSDMGELHVDIFSDDTWYQDVFTKSGNQNASWKKAEIDLIDFAGKTIAISFKGITGDNYKSDMALDDIDISFETSIEETNENNNVRVFPNPSKGNFTVYVKNENASRIKIQLNDISGKEILQLEEEEYKEDYEKTLDINKLANGFYFLRVDLDNQSAYVKIAKQ
jgi:hypothetical protein